LQFYKRNGRPIACAQEVMRVRFPLLLELAAGLCVPAIPLHCQPQEETLSGPDAHETPGVLPHGHVFGDWGGLRARLAERGVTFDLHYMSESFGNLKSEQNERFSSWNRFRATVDIDFGAMNEQPGLYFHATAVWQAGSNIGNYLGLLTNPSGIASANTFRLDSWWFEKRWWSERIAARAGQFAGQDTYGDQSFGTSFIFEPMSYAFGNLSTTLESGSPPATPAVEVRFSPFRNFYVKSMVLAGEASQFSYNPTGLVPQFRGNPVSVSEIGFTPGKKASSIHPADNATTRRGYTGLYQFGASYNPGKFAQPGLSTLRSGNYLLYGMASQALWRVDPKEAKGLDATFGYDWSPPGINRNNKELTAGLRFNEPLPLRIHNTMSLGYVNTSLSPQFLPSGFLAWKSERGTEFNTLFVVGPILLQPVVQYFANPGGGIGRDVVCGIRVKVEL
jgi:porin